MAWLDAMQRAAIKRADNSPVIETIRCAYVVTGFMAMTPVTRPGIENVFATDEAFPRVCECGFTVE